MSRAKTLSLGILGVAALLALAGYLAFNGWVIFTEARRPGFLSPGGFECLAAYRHARTAADTAMIDAHLPSMGDQKSPTAPTCGTMRRTGLIDSLARRVPANSQLLPTSGIRHSGGAPREIVSPASPRPLARSDAGGRTPR